MNKIWMEYIQMEQNVHYAIDNIVALCDMYSKLSPGKNSISGDSSFKFLIIQLLNFTKFYTVRN